VSQPKAYSYKSYGRGGWASSSEAVVDATLVVMGVVGKGARATAVREQGWLIGLDGEHRAKQVTLARRADLRGFTDLRYALRRVNIFFISSL
jgi:hypothetical protein